MNFADTICASASAPGTGALAVIRISGPDSFRVVSSVLPGIKKIVPRRAAHGRLVHDGKELDDAVITFFEGPASFTGEDSAEISCHGNPLIVRDIIRALVSLGARMAEPGEFTKRAFLNGKIDLTEAEAINHIITARSSWEISSAVKQMHGSLKKMIHELRDSLILIKADIECSIDFSAEEIEFISYADALTQIESIKKNIEDIRRRCIIGQKISRGVDLPIVGKPNAGKSSILNLILNADRAIVSELPGTTRDLIRETIQFGGVHVNLIDTAGIRDSDSEIERIGIGRSTDVIESSSVIIMVLDATTGITGEDREVISRLNDKKVIYLINKTDKSENSTVQRVAEDLGSEVLPFSAVTGRGLDKLESAVTRIITNEFVGAENSFVADERIITLLDSAQELCDQTSNNFKDNDPHEIAAFSIQSLIETLGEITGEISPDDVLHAIFSRFCIGK